jgi:hypothetical protein
MSRRASRAQRSASLSLGSLVGAILLSSTASAAVNDCLPLIKADPAEANAAMDAKRQALANWLERASTHGVEYTRWGIAWNRELACVSSGRGTIVCQAAGHPCTVRQVPSDNSIPFRRGTVPSAIDRESLAQEVVPNERTSSGHPAGTVAARRSVTK